MKNIQVIDGARNSVFEIYGVADDLFNLMFPDGIDVAFLDEVDARLKATGLDDTVWNKIYRYRADKKTVDGIHGTLHLTGSLISKKYFPTRREADVLRLQMDSNHE